MLGWSLPTRHPELAVQCTTAHDLQVSEYTHLQIILPNQGQCNSIHTAYMFTGSLTSTTEASAPAQATDTPPPHMSPPFTSNRRPCTQSREGIQFETERISERPSRPCRHRVCTVRLRDTGEEHQSKACLFTARSPSLLPRCPTTRWRLRTCSGATTCRHTPTSAHAATFSRYRWHAHRCKPLLYALCV